VKVRRARSVHGLGLLQCSFGFESFALNLSDPNGDHLRVDALLERGSVSIEAGVAVLDATSDCLGGGEVAVGRLGGRG
jgi:hypothetical protein